MHKPSLNNILSTLNDKQRQAVRHKEGPLLVLAGAGTGKTRVIIHKIAYLMLNKIDPKHILGVTFTNKAAHEMRERLKKLLGRASDNVHLSTFHSLGLTILREDYKKVGLRSGFSIYDTSDQLSLIRDFLRRIKVGERRLDAKRILDLILDAKRKRLQEISLDHCDDYELVSFDLYPRYIDEMRIFNAIDFDDLILKTLDILKDSLLLQKWQERFQYILVDEYQDTNKDQVEILRILSGKTSNICVVGDDDQSIYAFRGAKIDHILHFEKTFGKAEEVILDQNYRSTENILLFANKIIGYNKKRKIKELWSDKGSGDCVEIIACEDGEEEAEFVVEKILSLLHTGIKEKDIAILYRSNKQSRIFEETLALHHLTFQVIGGQAFFDRKEVRDAIAYLNIVNNPFNEMALRRIINVPPRGVGAVSMEIISNESEKTGKTLWETLLNANNIERLSKKTKLGCEKFVYFIQKTAKNIQTVKKDEISSFIKLFFEELKLYDHIMQSNDTNHMIEQRLTNLNYVIESLSRFEKNFDSTENILESYLSHSSLDTIKTQDNNNDTDITLMTMHSAKGLEFRIVFLVGMEEGLLPHKKTIEESITFEEERRLCYVGITRAKEKLWITWAKNRNFHGKNDPRMISRFLSDLPDHVAWIKQDVPPILSEVENNEIGSNFFKHIREQLDMESTENY